MGRRVPHHWGSGAAGGVPRHRGNRGGGIQTKSKTGDDARGGWTNVIDKKNKRIEKDDQKENEATGDKTTRAEEKNPRKRFPRRD